MSNPRPGLALRGPLAGAVLAFALASVGGIAIGAVAYAAMAGPTTAPTASHPPIAWPVKGPATAVAQVTAAPALALTDQDGRPFELATLRGKPALVFFGYTHCPDVCPTTLADARDALKRSAAPFAIVFVSIDPDRDTPAELKKFLGFYDIPIVGLTGSPTEVRVAADAWGVRYAKLDEGGTTGYAMAHTADAYLVDANGMLRDVIPFGAGADVMVDRMAAAAATPIVAAASPGPAAAPGGPATSPAASASNLNAALLTTVIREGRNRLVITIADAANRKLADPAIDLEVVVRSTDRPGEQPITVAGRFIWIMRDSMAGYVVDITFPSAGGYRASVSATTTAGTLGPVELPIAVATSKPVVGVGELAPSFDSPTGGSVGGMLSAISTDLYPADRLYEYSVATLLAKHRPFVLVFYSPTFCPNTECGPLLPNIKSVARDFPDFAFVHVEPYVMQDSGGGRIQPVIRDGTFVWAPWSVAYGIPIEPWIFVVGADGRVATSYELIVGTDELRAAIRSVEGGS